VGLHGRDAMERLERKKKSLGEIKSLLEGRRIRTGDAGGIPSLSSHIGESAALALKDPLVHITDLPPIMDELNRVDGRLLSHAELDIKYEGYIRRQEEQVARFQRMENLRIPEGFDYDGVTGLSSESREKLKRIRPVSIGQASRISGVRPADISVLLMYVGRR
jgi:tRNA uridine 5-carboxymethylaminomethyl modification enzyme